MHPYQLIACSFHDELEALATLHQTCEIQYRETDGVVHTVTSKIVDVYSRNGLGPVPRDHRADFIKLQDDIDIANWIRTDGLSTSFIPALEMS